MKADRVRRAVARWTGDQRWIVVVVHVAVLGAVPVIAGYGIAGSPATANPALDQTGRDEHAARVAATEKALRDVEQRRRRLIRALEMTADPDRELLRDINDRRTELTAEHATLTTELQRLHQQPNAALLDTLPIGDCDIAALPEPIARRLFEALRLEIHYHKAKHTALHRITLTADTLHTAQDVAQQAITPHAGSGDDTPDGHGGHRAHPFPFVMCPRQDHQRMGPGPTCASASERWWSELILRYRTGSRLLNVRVDRGIAAGREDADQGDCWGDGVVWLRNSSSIGARLRDPAMPVPEGADQESAWSGSCTNSPMSAFVIERPTAVAAAVSGATTVVPRSCVVEVK